MLLLSLVRLSSAESVSVTRSEAFLRSFFACSILQGKGHFGQDGFRFEQATLDQFAGFRVGQAQWGLEKIDCLAEFDFSRFFGELNKISR